MPGLTYFKRSKTSMPDIPDIRMSSTATSILLSCASLTAVGPSAAVMISQSSLKMSRIDSRGPSSSSTTNNVPLRFAPATHSGGGETASDVGAETDIVIAQLRAQEYCSQNPPGSTRCYRYNKDQT